MRRTLNFLKNSLLLIGFLLLGCENDEVDNAINDNTGEVVELYLIETYETNGDLCQIDESTVVTKATPLLFYSDFISYNSKYYIFEISEESKARIEELEFSTQGIPFAVKVDNELIYTGYFWPAYSSMVCNWIIIDPFFIDFYNGLKVQIGYPGTIPGIEIPDKRNASQILNVFRRDNKLIE